MLFFLTTQPIRVSGTILIGLTTVLAMLGPYVVRRHVALERLTTNNEVAGFKFATVGVLYAVLLAFAIFVVWQRYADAETTVAQEAGAADTIYRLSYGIGEKIRRRASQRAHQLSDYCDRRRLAGHGSRNVGRQTAGAARAQRIVRGAVERGIRSAGQRTASVRNSASARRHHPVTPRQARRHRARRHLAGSAAPF
jgi:hypothetical protein